MPVLDRSALAASPLADLHTIASELEMDGYRRLRKDELVDAILARQGNDSPPAVDAEPDAPAEEAERPARRPRRRGGRGRSRGEGRPETAGDESSEGAGAQGEAEPEEPSGRSRRSGRRRRAEEPAATEQRGDNEELGPDAEGAIVEGVVELLGNGSGFVRVSPPDPSDDDVYVSAAQVRRCELVSGDVVAGPTRPPRRSERYPSVARVQTINGAPADEVAEGTHFDDLPAGFPTDRLAFGVEDPTVKAIEWLTPLGKGSRVSVVGAPRAGKSEALRRLADALAAHEGLEVSVALAGVRPEESSEWASGPVAPVAAVTLGASADAQAQAVERAIEQGRRIAARGADAVVLVDGLDGLPPSAARKALAAARNIVDGGSLTVIAVAGEPLGGETTVIALDAALTSTRRFPALDLLRSGTLRPELLVGEAGAEAIASARAAALDDSA